MSETEIKSNISKIRALPFKKIVFDQIRYFTSVVVMPIYPLVIFLVLLYYLTSSARAGAIRKAEATEDRPTIVKLAKGRRTAIHFWEKPERVIPGSPGKVQIDFLGNDVTISPLATDPGNLLVYAHGTRFVVLLKIASESSYDDVVQLVPGKSKAFHAIRLDQDTYHLATFKITVEQSGKKRENFSQVLLKNEGRFGVVSDLADLIGGKSIKCGHCAYAKSDTTLVCQAPIVKVECHGSAGLSLSLQKVSE